MRIRVTFSKSGPLIYIGNLDLYTLWERTARRAGLPLAYSKGFHPQPKLHFGAPLPLGYASRCELMDVKLTEDVDLSSLPERLNAALPIGVRVLRVESIDEAAPALQTMVNASEYSVQVTSSTEPAELQRRANALMDAESLPRERRKKRYDLRPLIEAIAVASDEERGSTRITMRLKAMEGATGRPDEVLEAMEVARADARIERTRLMLRAEQDLSKETAGTD